MNQAAVSRELEARFACVVRSELKRLEKKMARFEAAQRHMVESIVAQVVGAIAVRPAEALAHDDEPLLVQALVELFGVPRDLDVGQP